MIKDDAVTCARYAQKHKLLDKPGWKTLRKFVNKKKKWRTMVRALRKKIRAIAPKYMFGVRIPKNYDEALQLDRENGNTLWADAIRKELEFLMSYNTFKDLGHKSTAEIPTGHKMIRCHGIYAVKHDLRHKY